VLRSRAAQKLITSIEEHIFTHAISNLFVFTANIFMKVVVFLSVSVIVSSLFLHKGRFEYPSSRVFFIFSLVLMERQMSTNQGP